MGRQISNLFSLDNCFGLLVDISLYASRLGGVMILYKGVETNGMASQAV